MRRAALPAGALACLALAAFLALVAADVMRWRGALREDDVRYRAVPAAGDLWRPAALAPLGVARKVLAIDDDLAFRRALRALRVGGLETPDNYEPSLMLLRAEAEARLAAIAAASDDRERRSRAAALLGVLDLSTRASDPQERAALVNRAVAYLQRAIALDPDNDEAKYNLEVALRRSRGVQQQQGGSAPTPSASTAGSKGAATGPPGSGY